MVVLVVAKLKFCVCLDSLIVLELCTCSDRQYTVSVFWGSGYLAFFEYIRSPATSQLKGLKNSDHVGWCFENTKTC